MSALKNKKIPRTHYLQIKLMPHLFRLQDLAVSLPPIDIGWCDIRVVKVQAIQFHPFDDYSFISFVDIGERFTRLVVTRLVKHYRKIQINDRKFIAICNINYINKNGPTATARLLVAAQPGKRELLKPPHGCTAGDLVTVKGYPRNLYSPLDALHRFNEPYKKPKRKIFRAVAPDLRVNPEGIATYRNIPLEVEGKGHITSKKLFDCPIR